MIKLISTITAALVAALAAGAFVLSFSALEATATAHGITAAHGWIFPLIVDGFIIVASLSVLLNSLKRQWTIYQWSLVVLATLVSVGFNVAHAPGDVLSQLIAAVAPIALFLAFELLMSQIKSHVRESLAVASLGSLQALADDQAAKLADLSAKIATSEARLATLKDESRQARIAANGEKKLLRNGNEAAPIEAAQAAIQDRIGDRRELVERLWREGLSVSEIADAAKNAGHKGSQDTIRRDVKALQDAGIIGTDGPEIVDLFKVVKGAVNEAAANGVNHG